MGTGYRVAPPDAPVLGEETYKGRPEPVFDGPNGLPIGWSRIEVTINGKRHFGAMSETAAALPSANGWVICPVRNGTLIRSQQQKVWLDDKVAAIVAAEMAWPRR